MKTRQEIKAELASLAEDIEAAGRGLSSSGHSVHGNFIEFNHDFAVRLAEIESAKAARLVELFDRMALLVRENSGAK
jgi:hypothetical protein